MSDSLKKSKEKTGPKFHNFRFDSKVSYICKLRDRSLFIDGEGGGSEDFGGFT